MNKKYGALVLVVALMLALGAVGCKHSGVAMTQKGQVMDIEITGADDLPDGFTDKLKVSVKNRGVNQLGGVEFTVEMPNELVVVNEKHGNGIDVMEMRSPEGKRIFHYRAGNIEVGTESDAEFEVRTAFGSLDRTDNIKVTAWQEDLPGDKLVETKMIKLRR